MHQEISTSKTCIQSRNIRSFLDDPQNERFTRLKKHLNECSACRVKLAEVKAELAELDRLIPVLHPSSELATSIHSEVVEAFRGVEVLNSTSALESLTVRSKAFGKWSVNFARFLVSKNMILTYLFSVALGFLINYLY